MLDSVCTLSRHFAAAALSIPDEGRGGADGRALDGVRIL